jgi:hypothetical protein
MTSWRGDPEVDAARPKPIQDGPAFQGLVAGDRVIVAIGEERLDEAEREIALEVLWVGLVDVKE